MGDKLAAIVRQLVLQRVVQVQTGPIGIEIAGADLSAGAEVAVGGLSLDLETLRQTIGPAHADSTVVSEVAASRNRLLDEAIGAPDRTGIELQLRDCVGAF